MSELRLKFWTCPSLASPDFSVPSSLPLSLSLSPEVEPAWNGKNVLVFFCLKTINVNYQISWNSKGKDDPLISQRVRDLSPSYSTAQQLPTPHPPPRRTHGCTLPGLGSGLTCRSWCFVFSARSVHPPSSLGAGGSEGLVCVVQL